MASEMQPLRSRAFPFSVLALSMAGLMLFPILLKAQEASSNAVYSAESPGYVNGMTAMNASEPAEKRIFGVIPNFRTSESPEDESPLKPEQKFKIASQDAFDRGTFMLAGVFAGESWVTKSEPTFGNGGADCGRYFGTAYADLAIGDFMTEAVFPTLLHQDPRYFRKGEGTISGRLRYAAVQLFRTRTDTGIEQFNYSEVVGNATAVAISNAYYPDDRNAANAVSKFAFQLGVDGAANILKEFAPDIHRMFSRKHRVTGR